MQTVIIGKFTFIVPKGYRHVRWEHVKKNDTVYTIGTCQGSPVSYGPFKVNDSITRQLFSPSREVIFEEPVESLLIKE